MFWDGMARIIAVGAVLVWPAPSQVASARSPATVPVYDRPISRTQVMVRALDWLRRDIAYSQDNGRAGWDLNRGRRYRPDCSGFVSMAWAIDPLRPGLGRALVTWELPRVSTRIRWAQLRRGDILLRLDAVHRANEHVRLFAGWVDPARTRAWVIEQSGRTHGMRRQAVVLAAARRGYLPYRYHRIV